LLGLKHFDRLVRGRLPLLAEDLSVRQVNGVSELGGVDRSCIAGTYRNEVPGCGGLDLELLFQILASEPIPSKGDDTIQHDRRFDELGVARNGPFGVAR
jgi:hypothetical protein